MYEQFFLHFSKLVFFLSNAKIIPLIIFYVFTLLLLFLTLNSNFTKERKMYKHVWTYFIYNYTCL